MPNINQRRVIDPILSTVVQGYRHPGHVGMALFPEVPVAAAGGQVLEFGVEDFKLYNTIRAPGAAFKRVQFGYLGKPFALENHGLESPAPREHARDAMVVPGVDIGTLAVSKVLRIISLGREAQQAALATNAANYDAAHKITLSGTSQFSDKTGSDPYSVIDTGREAIRASVGLDPNVMVISAKAAKALKRHPAIRDDIKYTQSGVTTAQLLAELFEVARVEIAGAVTFSDATPPVAADVWGKDIVLAYVPPNPSTQEEPSYGYTYTMAGHPATEQPYWENQSASWIYRVVYERVPVLTGITSGYLIKDAVA